MIDHTELMNTKHRAAALYVTLEGKIESVEREVANLNNDASRKRYTADYLRAQVADARQKAKEFAALQGADLQSVKSRLESHRKNWSTEFRLKNARLVPESDRVESDLLNELRYLRVASDLSAATPNELLESINEAREGGNLALIAMARKEIGRRAFENDSDSARVKVAIQQAIETVEIPGQKAAQKLIDEAQTLVDSVEDALAHLSTGFPTKRAEMRAAMAKHSKPENVNA